MEAEERSFPPWFIGHRKTVLHSDKKWDLLREMPAEIRRDGVTRHNVIGISACAEHQSRQMKHVPRLDCTSVGGEEVLHPGGLAVAVQAYVMR